MSKKPLNISEEAAVQMPMKTVASLIALVAIGTWAYFGLHETLNNHATKIELMQKDLEQNSEFRIKYPRGELGQSSGEAELFMLVEHLAGVLEEVDKEVIFFSPIYTSTFAFDCIHLNTTLSLVVLSIIA